MNRSVDVDVFGKAPKYVMFSDGLVIEREKTPQPLLLFQSNVLNQVWIAGHSLSGKKEFFTCHKYPDGIYGASDSAFHAELMGKFVQYAVFDNFNLVAYRNDDISKHTWKVSSAALKKKSKRTLKNISEVII